MWANQVMIMIQTDIRGYKDMCVRGKHLTFDITLSTKVESKVIGSRFCHVYQ